jgi:hypothetical protein
MSNPTSNFGWQMPTSTDLVTDLPADFEVFGQAVDTSLADLKGGTTGQVLKKNTDTDMDFVWAADSAGMTNPMTTTGDTIYSSSGSTPARLGIGTAGQVLQVNSGATAPEWATASSGSMTEIATGTLSGSSVSITSIPSTYNDLRLVLRGAYTDQDGFPIYVRFNGDSTANRHMATRNSAGSNIAFGATRSACTANQDSSTGTGAFTTITFSDYANTSTWKTFDSKCSIANYETTPTNAVVQTTILAAYNQTGAVSSIDLLPDSGTFTGGTYILYGVK